MTSTPSDVVSSVVIQCFDAMRAAVPVLNCTMRFRAFAPSGPASLATLSSLSRRIESQIAYWRHLSTSFRCGWRQIWYAWAAARAAPPEGGADIVGLRKLANACLR